MKVLVSTLLLSVATIALTGCGSSSSSGELAQVTPVSIDGSKFILTEEPDDAVGVIEARESAENGAPVVVVGRIGGSVNPWIQGRAAFLLLDASMSVVAEGQDSGGPELCTGDCCESERAGCTTLVKVVDAEGKLVAADSRQLLGVAENDFVVVRGKVNKDESGNIIVLADGVFVRR